MNRTFLYLLLAFLALPFTGCKKFIDEKKEEAAIEVITSGRWKITQFSRGSTDLLARWNGYEFQFNPNETVDAYLNGTQQANGSWAVNVTARTVTSQFASASEPLSFLNGTWNITSTTDTSVDAERVENGETFRMHMDKQ